MPSWHIMFSSPYEGSVTILSLQLLTSSSSSKESLRQKGTRHLRLGFLATSKVAFWAGLKMHVHVEKRKIYSSLTLPGQWVSPPLPPPPGWHTGPSPAALGTVSAAPHDCESGPAPVGTSTPSSWASYLPIPQKRQIIKPLNKFSSNWRTVTIATFHLQLRFKFQTLARWPGSGFSAPHQWARPA